MASTGAKESGYTPVGFKNLGNTCYLNSVLQSILPFAVRWVVGPATGSEEDENKIQESIEALSNSGASKHLVQLHQLCRTRLGKNENAKDRHKEVLTRLKVIKALASMTNNEFSGNDQCDAFDFFATVVDLIHAELNSGSSGYKEIDDRKKGETEQAMGARWVRSLLAKNRSPVYDELGIVVQTTTLCTRCQGKSFTFSHDCAVHVDLSEDVLRAAASVNSSSNKNKSSGKLSAKAQKKIASKQKAAAANVHLTLDQLLASTFSGTEEISGYNCKRCKEQDSVSGTVAHKTQKIVAFPHTLVVHFKRFTWDEKKISVPIDYRQLFTVPSVVGTEVEEIVSALDRGGEDSAASIEGAPIQYALAATITHHGKRLGDGHYTASVCPDAGCGRKVELSPFHNVQTGSKWYDCNDERVTAMKESSACDSNAYILVHSRLRDTTDGEERIGEDGEDCGLGLEASVGITTSPSSAAEETSKKQKGKKGKKIGKERGANEGDNNKKQSKMNQLADQLAEMRLGVSHSDDDDADE